MKVNDVVHFWQHCHHCNASPIVGLRYECQSCPAGPDIDLCSTCFDLFKHKKVEHPLESSHTVQGGEHRFLLREGTASNLAFDWLDVPVSESCELTFKKTFIVRPEFCCGQESFFGGYGFVVHTSIGRVLLTALHVLDEVIKSYGIDASVENEKYTGFELPAIVESVNLYDVMQDKWMFYDKGYCKSMVVLPNARLGNTEPFSCQDISAFLLDASVKIESAKLASASPEIGEPVWLAAKISNESGFRKAVVVDKNEHSFVFRYDDSEELPKTCSGAPILDKFGNVVAINVGAGYFENKRFGHGNHTESIQKHLAIN